jgi:hypothetical protein
MVRAGYACFVCHKEGSSLEQEEGLFSLCSTASFKINTPAKIVEHMAMHMLFDRNPQVNCCDFCLSTDSFCSIQLKKRKRRNGTNKIDLEHSSGLQTRENHRTSGHVPTSRNIARFPGARTWFENTTNDSSYGES